MQIYVQDTRLTVADDFPVDHLGWPQLPKRSVPATGELGGGDNSLGWINALTVMGITYHSDHYCVRDNGDGGVLVTAWDDDTDDRGDGRVATESTYYQPAPDPVLGNRINTKYTVKIYADPITLGKMAPMSERGDSNVIAMLDYAEFSEPADDIYTRHGVWCSDDKFAELEAARTPHGWRLWIE